MNSQWVCVEIKMKRWWWWVFLARSPSLDETFLDLESYIHKIKLGIDQENIPKKGYISAQKWGRKREENHVFSTYMSWRMIEMVLEFLFPCLIYPWITRMKKMMKFLETFLVFLWEREWAEGWEGEKKIVVVICIMVIEIFGRSYMMAKILRNGLAIFEVWCG